MSLQKSMTPLNVKFGCFVIEGIDKLLSGDGVGGDLLFIDLDISKIQCYCTFGKNLVQLIKSPLLSNEIGGGEYIVTLFPDFPTQSFSQTIILSLLNNFSRAPPALLLLSKGP